MALLSGCMCVREVSISIVSVVVVFIGRAEADHVAVGSAERGDFPPGRMLNGAIEGGAAKNECFDRLVDVVNGEVEEGGVANRERSLGFAL